MIIEYTPEELARLEEIKQQHKQYILALTEAMEKAEGREHKKLANELTLERVALGMELRTFTSECERRRFEEIADDPDAIIASVKDQVPRLLEYEHDHIPNEDISLSELKKLDIAEVEGDSVRFKANFAASLIISELKYHLDALKDDKRRLQEAYSIIVEGVESSDRTNNEEITLSQETPVEILRFRRSPLADISTFGIMNDKVSAQIIQDGEVFQQKTDGQIMLRWAVNQAPQNKNDVPVFMALTYEGSDFKITKKLSDYDKRVYEAVGTRFYYWQQTNPQKPLYISPQEIWRTMNGKSSSDGKANPSATQIKRICESLDKMRFTRFYMDISAEIKAFNLSINDERITGGRIETYVLNCSKVEFTTDKGGTVQGYRISEEPILYTYNRVKNHILYVPYDLLDTSKYTSDGQNVTEFKGYLLQQIQLMKNAQEGSKRFKRSHTILLETIYKDTGVKTPEERAESASFKSDNARQTYLRKTRAADRSKIEGMLDAWKDKKWIEDYAPVKKGQQVRGYKINI